MSVLNALHLSDTHLAADPSWAVYGQNADANLAAVLRAAERRLPSPDLVIASGDLADDASAEGYARLGKMLLPVAPVLRWVPGNHDDPQTMQRCLPGPSPSDAPLLHLGDWCFVFLDSKWPGQDVGRLDDRQHRLLSTALESSGGLHTAIVLHHPPLSPCSNADCGLADAERFLHAIEPYPNVGLVLSGHVHVPFEVQTGGPRFLGAPSTCVQITHHGDSHEFSPEFPGCRFLRLHPDGEVETDLVWAAHSPA